MLTEHVARILNIDPTDGALGSWIACQRFPLGTPAAAIAATWVAVWCAVWDEE